MHKTLGPLAVAAAVALAFSMATREAQAGPVATQPAGRFQVVNPNPGIMKSVFLIDSSTGNTWTLCEDEDGSPGWCQMERTNARAVTTNGSP